MMEVLRVNVRFRIKKNMIPTLILAKTFLTRKGDNYLSRNSNFYWSVLSQNCLVCPTNYSSGVGLIYQYQSNPITNRCYLINNQNFLTFNNAQNACTNVNGYLFPVGTIYEFLMAYNWANSVRTYWLYGIINNNVWYTWNSQTFSSTASYWCLGNIGIFY